MAEHGTVPKKAIFTYGLTHGAIIFVRSGRGFYEALDEAAAKLDPDWKANMTRR